MVCVVCSKKSSVAQHLERERRVHRFHHHNFSLRGTDEKCHKRLLYVDVALLELVFAVGGAVFVGHFFLLSLLIFLVVVIVVLGRLLLGQILLLLDGLVL